MSRTRVIVHAVRPVIGPFSGQACKQERLRPRRGSVIGGLFIAGRLLVDRLDLVAFGRGQISLRAGPVVSREGIGQRPGIGLPDTTLYALLVRQGKTDCRGKVGAQPLIRLAGARAAPPRGIKAVAVTN
jgi:hypothetical protein